MRPFRLVPFTLLALALPAIGLAASRLTAVRLEVPPALASDDLAQAHTLQVPEGFGVRVIARVRGARFLALTPDGRLLVSQPSSGRLSLLTPDANGIARQDTFASGLKSPQGMAFHREGPRTWLYVAETHRVVRYAWRDGMTQAGAAQVIVPELPSRLDARFFLHYNHPLKNIAISPAGKLYVAIGSTCNVCDDDPVADPVRGAVYVYDADGSNGRPFARGLRNAEGLSIRPGSEELWVAVNNRDNIPYPYHKDFDGDGSDDYGRVIPAFVDDNPPEPFTRVRDGGHYGWPWCNPDPRSPSGYFDMPFDRDLDTNADGKRFDCDKADRISLGLPAHSAPLGMHFVQDSKLPAPWHDGAIVILHGCWNCTRFNGHKLVFIPFTADGKPGAPQDMITGWVTDAATKQRWGRPVDAVPTPGGGLYVSDDSSDAVYELYPRSIKP